MIVAEFIDTYSAMVALIQGRLAERGGPERAFEAPETVAASFTGMPRNLILGLQPDGAFIAAAYYKLLDREVEPAELASQLERLAASAVTRSALLDELSAGDEAAERGVRVEWVDR